MEKQRAIPEGYITVGELAKKMNTTVRTLQYYDKEGLLCPSAQSEGGRRLYDDKDVFRLTQIQCLKYLGFSLDEIKGQLTEIDTSQQVVEILESQAEKLKERIASLEKVLDVIEKLRDETLLIKEVDFKRYADIIINLQMNNQFYGLVKHMDQKTLDYFHSNFDMINAEEIINTLNSVCQKTEELKLKGIPPQSAEGQALGKEWWEMVEEFTQGDMSLLNDLVGFAQQNEDWEKEWKERWGSMMEYLQDAMQAYFIQSGINPFRDTSRDDAGQYVGA